MRGTRVGMGVLGAALLALAGCQTPNTTIKPTLHEEYTLPPSDDARFSSPPTFPKEVMDNQFKKQPSKMGDQMSGPPSRFGAGAPGMGGY